MQRRGHCSPWMGSDRERPGNPRNTTQRGPERRRTLFMTGLCSPHRTWPTKGPPRNPMRQTMQRSTRRQRARTAASVAFVSMHGEPWGGCPTACPTPPLASRHHNIKNPRNHETQEEQFHIWVSILSAAGSHARALRRAHTSPLERTANKAQPTRRSQLPDLLRSPT
jgi:hypothetical protein